MNNKSNIWGRKIRKVKEMEILAYCDWYEICCGFKRWIKYGGWERRGMGNSMLNKVKPHELFPSINYLCKIIKSQYTSRNWDFEYNR